MTARPMGDLHERHDYLAWGGLHRFRQRIARPFFIDELPPILAARGNQSLLGSGCRRSYGDSGLNADNILIDMRGLDHLLAFDPTNGIVEAEAGLTLANILALARLSQNGAGQWFLPATPGTKFVTLGGAIANDVHGKNHHAAGCFGNHVLSLRLMRSDGTVLTCSPQENAELFKATIGGLGLTGLILSARFALKNVPGLWMEQENIRFATLDEFYVLAEKSYGWEYTVAWVDCFAPRQQLGRGVFTRARHVAAPANKRSNAPASKQLLTIPAALPNFILNTTTMKAFNTYLWYRASTKPTAEIVPFEKVLYPLDSIAHWNRIYGRRGFFQHQCVVPTAYAKEAMRSLLTEIRSAGLGSFLAVLKTFGDRPSPGMLSFPMEGTTLALDFPNTGAPTLALLDRLDDICTNAGGRVYAAKDGRIPARKFQQGYPAWKEFLPHVDPAFSSSFWRRVSAVSETGKAA